MTCHINKSSKFLGNIQIQKTLFPHLNNDNVEQEEADWESGWADNWETEEDLSKVKKTEQEESWLHNCLVALSPLSDLLVFAYGSTAVILTAKWECGDGTSEEQKVFHISYSGILKEDDQSDKITSLHCLPLPSQKRTLEGGAECICLVAGYSSGFLRIFTEHGKLLLEQLFHQEPLYSISHDPRTDQLVLVYGAVVVCLENFALYQSLRACRNQLARVSAGTWGSIHIPPLSYKKWELSGVGDVADCAYAGLLPHSRLDQLVRTSIRRGTAQESHPHHTTMDLVVTTGAEPYMGLYSVSEVAQPPLLSSIVSSLASALLSRAGSVLRWPQSSRNNQPALPKIEPATPLPLRLGLFDRGRQGMRLSLAPHHTLAAVSDTFGRVLLYDLLSASPLRLWKGYRDAECGWIQLEEETEGKTKKALFLVIYAQKRGIVEIWAMQHGPRVAAFNVSKSARLLQVWPPALSGGQASPSSCYLLDTDGSIYTFAVPFLCSFNEVNCKRTKDVHILKEIRTCLKEIPANRDRALADICQLVLTMKTANILQQGLEGILHSPHIDVDFIHQLVASLRQHLEEQEQLAYDWKIILQTCVNTERLMSLHTHITGTACLEEGPQEVEWEESLKSMELQEAVLWSLPLYSQLDSLPGCAVEVPDSISHFLRCFHLFPSHLLKSLSLQPQLEPASKISLGKFLFHTALKDSTNLKPLTTALEDSQVAPQELMECLLRYWLSSHLVLDPQTWSNFAQLADVLTQHEDGWLKDLRPLTAQAPNLPAAYVACQLLRQQCARRATAHPCEDWEPIDLETEHWGSITTQLQSLLPLGLLLNSRPLLQQPASTPGFSLASLQATGAGAITDLVAKWSLDQGLDCQELLDSTHSDQTADSIHSLNFAKEAMARVRSDLPRSLEPASLAVTCAWEHLTRWMASGFSKEVLLEGAVQCLSQVAPGSLRQGVCMMIWKTFVLKKLEALAFLIEKVGRTPKARLCLRDLELSDQHLESFLELCHQLLVLMVEQPQQPELENSHQELWEDGATGGPSLVALAQAQESPVFALLEHHLQLVLCLQLIVRCQLRSVHPLSLFHPLLRQAFFKSLSLRGVKEVEDPALVEPRQQFVVKAVAGLAGQLAEVLDICQTDLETVRPHTGTAARWLDRTIKLTHSWNLSSGPVYQYWVVELYSAGLDFVAEEYLQHVADRGALGLLLYQIAGLRIHEEIFEKEFSVAKQSHFTKPQREWIHKLKRSGKLRFYHPRLLQPTVSLLDTAAKYMANTEKFAAEGRMASELLSSLRNLAAEPL